MAATAAVDPFLFLYAVIGRFEGYFPGYSSMVATHPNYLTWVVLKGHTNNTAGEVTLRSADPRVITETSSCSPIRITWKSASTASGSRR